MAKLKKTPGPASCIGLLVIYVATHWNQYWTTKTEKCFKDIFPTFPLFWNMYIIKMASWASHYKWVFIEHQSHVWWPQGKPYINPIEGIWLEMLGAVRSQTNAVRGPKLARQDWVYMRWNLTLQYIHHRSPISHDSLAAENQVFPLLLCCFANPVMNQPWINKHCLIHFLGVPQNSETSPNSELPRAD